MHKRFLATPIRMLDIKAISETKVEKEGGTTVDTGSGTVDSATESVKVINDKDVSTPGGVIMTIAPYALMVVLAGAFAVVFLTRRNRAE